MTNARVRRKLFAGYVLVVLPILAVLAEITTGQVERGLIEGETTQLRALARLVAGTCQEWLVEPADADGRRSDGRLRAILGGGSGLRVSLIAADGELLADTEPRTPRPTDEGSRTEIVQARGEGEGSSLRNNVVTRASTSFLAIRVPPQGELLGFVRVGADRGLVEERVDSIRTAFFVAAVAGLVLALGIASWQSRSFARPIAELTAAAEAMAHGNFDAPMAGADGSGLDGLATALERVAIHNRERMDVMSTDRNKVLAILGVMVEGVVAVDAVERIVHMNVAAGRILDAQTTSTEGRRVLEVTRVPEVHAILERVLRSGRAENGELRVVHPPRDRHVELRATPLHDADGDLAGAVLMLHDVTELRRLEAVRRDFVANVSHELKTPITAIRGLVETVLDDGSMAPELRQDFLSRVRDQSFRLSSLVTDLLTLSRLESDGLVGDMEPVDLREPIRDCVEALAQPAEAKRIALRLELPNQPVRVIGEAESLRLVIGNLVDNAVKYTPAGGHVLIRLRVAERDAVIGVEDDGIGIEPKHLDRIFQRFYRVDKARSREVGGTGLGLSIVRHVCIAHRGDVSVHSEVGRGTTFRVRLPLA